MNWIFALLLGFSTVNFLTLLLIFYYANRNWEKLIELQNYLNCIDKNVWNNTLKLSEIHHKANSK